MTKDNDIKSGPNPGPNFGLEPAEETEGLSATAMFLRSFDTPRPPAEPPAAPGSTPNDRSVINPHAPGLVETDWLTASTPKSSAVVSAEAAVETPKPPQPAFTAPQASSGGNKPPGEFTQFFKADVRSDPPATPAFAAQPPAPLPPSKPMSAATIEPSAPPRPDPGPKLGQGEFTRIFVSGSSANPERSSVPQAPLPPPVTRPSPDPAFVNTARHKGFSTPGISDSASTAGSFTRAFSDPPASRPSPFPPAGPVEAVGQPPAPTPPAGPSTSFSVTDIFSSRASPAVEAPPQQPPARPAYPTSFPPAFSAPAPESRPSDMGSATRLIERLSQAAVLPPIEPVRAEPPAFADPGPLPSVQPSSTGPGEFTRIISRSSGAGTVAGTGAPSAPAAAPAPAAEAPAASAKPAAAKAPDPPAAPAPKKSALESLVPILLVVNTFLLLLILLVTVFGLKGR